MTTSDTPRISPKLGERIAAELRAEAARRGIPHAELARQIDRTPMWVSRRLSPSILQPMTLDDLALFADALGVHVVDLLGSGLRPNTEGVTR